MANRSKKDIEAKIIAKAWKDPVYKKKLLSHPKEALNEMGDKIPDRVKVRVVEDSKDSFTFVLPASPANIQKLSPGQLEQLAAGVKAATNSGDPQCNDC